VEQVILDVGRWSAPEPRAPSPVARVPLPRAAPRPGEPAERPVARSGPAAAQREVPVGSRPAAGAKGSQDRRTGARGAARAELFEVVHRHQEGHGPHRLRLVGVGIALVTLTPAIWLPDVLAGAGPVGAAVAVVVGLVLLGFAANGLTLYQLARGCLPPDVPPTSPARHRAGSRRLWWLMALPGGLTTRVLYRAGR
jgi:hypothetical protein